MKQFFLMCLLAMSCMMTVRAQEDITASYLKNPSFEEDDISTLAADADRGAYKISNPKSWTLSSAVSDFGVSDIMTSAATATDNNFGAPGSPADGTQMYYLRSAWKAETVTLTQTVTLPAGRYRLEVNTKCVRADAAQSADLMAGKEVVALPIGSGAMPSTWDKAYVDFKLTAEGQVALGVKANFVNKGGLSILLDNFHLYDISNEEEPQTPTENDVLSHTEGVINADFVAEAQMKQDLLQMLADFSLYMKNDWTSASVNSEGEACGYFNGEKSGQNNEQGVRPNADLSMICAFLVKYAKPAGVTLPTGVTWEYLEDRAMKSLVYAYSTHKANKLKTCTNSAYWGSTSTSDAVWESSLWAMSVAYSAYFQWDKLTDTQKKYIYAMLKAECNYELGRSIPAGYSGDTKAEENGWEVDILAATLGLFPDDELAAKWFDRMRAFAVNSYSHTSDASNTTVIDADYDNKTVADYYVGANLYDDYSLQNHNLFHTSYQNVVMQELGEAALALKLFQTGLTGSEKWKSNALMHNNQKVQDNILNWLALADGELAMPNGNDWSLFLYDQITSYSTQACFQRDADALMLENLAYKYIKARQKTTTDGSWLLRADVGARRMGVEAHRVMMTYLMHEVLSTADMTPTVWSNFNKKYSEAKMIPCQNVVRASSDYRFSCFSWSNGLKSYTGYFAANSVDKNKIVVPYRANNTGNITGWYDVSGKSAGASPVVSGVYQLEGNSYVMNGELSMNGASLDNRFAIYTTPENAIIYLDYVTANQNVSVTADKIGLLAISTDDLMKQQRTLYYAEGDEITRKQTNGASFATFESEWLNIDNELGVVSKNGKNFAFGNREANNSIYTSKLYPTYSSEKHDVAQGGVVDAHNIVYYSLVNAEKTKSYAADVMPLRTVLPEGWNGVVVPDETMAYVLISNFAGAADATVSGLSYKGEAPVFFEPTTVEANASSVSFKLQKNNSIAQGVPMTIKGSGVVAQLIDNQSAYVTGLENGKVTVNFYAADGVHTQEVEVAKDKTIIVSIADGDKLSVSEAELPEIAVTDYTGWIVNPAFDGSSAYGWNGAPATNYNEAEKFDTTFDVYQVITGLPAGKYELTCQGFYRNGNYTPAATARTNGTESLLAMLYANDAEVELMSIFENADKKGAVGVKTAHGYVPDNMEQVSLYFAEGLYVNRLICNVGEDGVLRIGVRKQSTVSKDWAIFDNFTLTYLGESDPKEEDTAVKYLGSDKKVEGIYNLMGQRLPSINGQKGIMIIDGKRVLVK